MRFRGEQRPDPTLGVRQPTLIAPPGPAEACRFSTKREVSSARFGRAARPPISWMRQSRLNWPRVSCGEARGDLGGADRAGHRSPLGSDQHGSHSSTPSPPTRDATPSSPTSRPRPREPGTRTGGTRSRASKGRHPFRGTPQGTACNPERHSRVRQGVNEASPTMAHVRAPRSMEHGRRDGHRPADPRCAESSAKDASLVGYPYARANLDLSPALCLPRSHRSHRQQLTAAGLRRLLQSRRSRGARAAVPSGLAAHRAAVEAAGRRGRPPATTGGELLCSVVRGSVRRWRRWSAGGVSGRRR